jgi:HPt (histidine-containing phosphotransfer) domain-containing protein
MSGNAATAPEAGGNSAIAPVLDRAHLVRQTLDDVELQGEVLALFSTQADQVRDKLPAADSREREMLAHGLRGSAASIGAMAVARAAAILETEPERHDHVAALLAAIEDVQRAIAGLEAATG